MVSLWPPAKEPVVYEVLQNAGLSTRFVDAESPFRFLTTTALVASAVRDDALSAHVMWPCFCASSAHAALLTVTERLTVRCENAEWVKC